MHTKADAAVSVRSGHLRGRLGQVRDELVDQLGQFVGTLLHELVTRARQHVELGALEEPGEVARRTGPG